MPLTEFRARIQQAENEPIIPVVILASDDVTKLPREEAERQLSQLLHQVRVKPELFLYEFRTLASYVDPPPRESLLGHNTVVEVSLPYTLHLPSNAVFDVERPQTGSAAVVLRKVWTDLAAGSNEAEIFADDGLLYYGPTQPTSPTIPQAPELGPWPRFTGKNIEIAKDTHGVFRYTQVRVFFDSATVEIEGLDKDAAGAAKWAALEEATKTGMEIINYLLDVYRYVSGAEHVERLSTMNVNRVYFADQNVLSEGVGVEGGVGSAIVNRSAREIRQIREMLSAGTEPARHVLLMQSARAALNRGQLVLAVVVAFQALEIILETNLRDGYSRQGVDDSAITDKLKKRCYKTKDRLTVLCREVTGGNSVADDTVFWNSWLNDCNKRRNRVVHRNEPLMAPQAMRVVELCEQCIARLSALPFP